MQAKGEFALVTKNIETARKTSGQPVKRGTMAHEHHMQMLLTEAAAQRGEAEALQRSLPRLEELAKRDKHKLYAAIAQRARSVLQRLAGEYDEAEAHLEQALEVFSELGTRWQSGRTLFEMGELAAARENPEAARQYYQRALGEFESLQALPDFKRTTAALQSLK
ncbi:MAG: tetratricopeptide repeat protein [Anaerolineales bacterium]|nr:MAG: tetratricopeptide repeat protein [Anaerolineales bacterium]